VDCPYCGHKYPAKHPNKKKSTSGLFAEKKKPIQSKVRSLEKLPAIVLSQGRMMKPKGEEQ